MKIFLWLVRKKSITENFVKRKLRPLSVSVMVQRIFFILSLIANALYAFFLWNLLFHFLKSRLFFPVKAYCVYMVNKIIDGRLQIWNFSSRGYLFYILLLDTLLVRCSRSRDNKLNIRREILYQSAPKYYSLFIEWVQNSRVCHTASIQNPLKVTIFKEFQCVTVARSLSDRFSHSPAIIDCWPQKKLLMNVKPSNLLISAPAKISQG